MLQQPSKCAVLDLFKVSCADLTNPRWLPGASTLRHCYNIRQKDKKKTSKKWRENADSKPQEARDLKWFLSFWLSTVYIAVLLRCCVLRQGNSKIRQSQTFMW